MEEKEARIKELEQRLREVESENARLRELATSTQNKKGLLEEVNPSVLPENGLSASHIERYSRQLLLRGGFGVEGQRKLLASSVLIVGAGGIGSTVILYLAACGIGKLTIIDFDEVDVSNLHRQVIHKTSDVGMNKAKSACKAVKDLNPTIKCEPFDEPLTTSNAVDLISKHDCVVDASDNPKTRYLINDACVLAGKPLISGSAMGVEGQLTVYNYKQGPCYRCLYPKPNAAEGCKSCADNGVLGPVPGMIGVLQAVETLKVITEVGTVMHDRLIMYDSLGCSFLRVKKPPKQPKCPVCGPEPTITSMEDSDRASTNARGPSCNISANDVVSHNSSDGEFPAEFNISCEEYNEVRKKGGKHILLDVRVEEQFALCYLEGAVNIPLKDLKEKIDKVEELSNGAYPVYCLCRRGIASIDAAKILSEYAKSNSRIHSVKNIRGGLDAWRRQVDSAFPKY